MLQDDGEQVCVIDQVEVIRAGPGRYTQTQREGRGEHTHAHRHKDFI